MTSSCGQSAKLVVGVIFNPVSDATGSVVFHTTCACTPAAELNT